MRSSLRGYYLNMTKANKVIPPKFDYYYKVKDGIYCVCVCEETVIDM